MRRLFALLAMLVLFPFPAAAQDEVNVVFLNSDPVVAVHSGTVHRTGSSTCA